MKSILDYFDPEEEALRDWRLLVGPGAGFYLQQWRLIRSGQWLTFNGWALIFGALWLFYRKMWREGIVFLAMYFAEGYLEKTFFPFFYYRLTNETWLGLRLLLFHLLLAFAANGLYLLYAERQIVTVQQHFPPAHQTVQLRRRGGVSFAYVALFILAFGLTLWKRQDLLNLLGWPG